LEEAEAALYIGEKVYVDKRYLMEGDLSQDEWPLPVGDPPYVEFEMYQDNCAEYLTQYDESGKTRERYNIIYDYHVVYYYIK